MEQKSFTSRLFSETTYRANARNCKKSSENQEKLIKSNA